jgi:predicted lipoprotein with Yx(FWY)xxD motif
LVDPAGLTLYVDVKDMNSKGKIKSVCDAACEKSWLPYIYDPDKMDPLTKSSDPVLSRLNIFTRADGKQQYAYGTQPLYRYISDMKPGDVTGPITGDWLVAQ